MLLFLVHPVPLPEAPPVFLKFNLLDTPSYRDPPLRL